MKKVGRQPVELPPPETKGEEADADQGAPSPTHTTTVWGTHAPITPSARSSPETSSGPEPNWRIAIREGDFTRVYGIKAQDVEGLVQEYQEATGKMNDELNDTTLYGKQPHIVALESRLSFLRYILNQADQPLSLHSVKRLWSACVEYAITQKVRSSATKTRSVGMTRRPLLWWLQEADVLFEWLSLGVPAVESTGAWNTQKAKVIMEERVVVSTFKRLFCQGNDVSDKWITSSVTHGFVCFQVKSKSFCVPWYHCLHMPAPYPCAQTLFRYVNTKNRGLGLYAVGTTATSQDSIRTVVPPEDLIGIDALWRMATHAKREAARKVRG